MLPNTGQVRNDLLKAGDDLSIQRTALAEGEALVSLLRRRREVLDALLADMGFRAASTGLCNLVEPIDTSRHPTL